MAARARARRARPRLIIITTASPPLPLHHRGLVRGGGRAPESAAWRGAAR
jgi:hypothetical protein